MLSRDIESEASLTQDARRLFYSGILSTRRLYCLAVPISKKEKRSGKTKRLVERRHPVCIVFVFALLHAKTTPINMGDRQERLGDASLIMAVGCLSLGARYL